MYQVPIDLFCHTGFEPMQVVAQADAFNIGATEQTEGKRKRRDQNPRGWDAPEQPHPGQHTAKQQHRDDPG